jgi:chemotaxis signal transduction protein
VPVLQVLATLGLGRDTAAPAPLLAVVEYGRLCMGVPVQAVRDVQLLDLSAAQPAVALGLAPSPILSGLLPLPDGSRALLIDVQALVAADSLSTLSAAPDSPDADRQAAVQAHVAVQAGTAWALPLSDLLEIIGLPEAWNSGPDPMAPWCHTWRQRAVPLWDLGALKGHGATPASADAKVLILQSDRGPFGLVVEALLHLLPARNLELHQMRLHDGRRLPFIVDRQEPEQRSFAVLGPQDWPRALVH